MQQSQQTMPPNLVSSIKIDDRDKDLFRNLLMLRLNIQF